MHVENVKLPLVVIDGYLYFLHALKRRKANWLGHSWNCLLKRFIEEKIQGRIEVTGKRGRRSKHPLDDLKE